MQTGQLNQALHKQANMHTGKHESRQTQAGLQAGRIVLIFTVNFFSPGRKVSAAQRARDALYTSAGDPGPQKYQERGPQELSC
jgi:hypothetical protein